MPLDTLCRYGKLVLVDLAGSERLKDTGSTGVAAKLLQNQIFVQLLRPVSCMTWFRIPFIQTKHLNHF